MSKQLHCSLEEGRQPVSLPYVAILVTTHFQRLQEEKPLKKKCFFNGIFKILELNTVTVQVSEETFYKEYY